jgi:Homing endonuclease associated repeat
MNPGPRPGFRWTSELIVYAIELWQQQHLRIPTTNEWVRAGTNHPSRVTVIRRFGSWNKAMAAAGFRPRRPSQRRAPRARERCPVTGKFVAGSQ